MHLHHLRDVLVHAAALAHHHFEGQAQHGLGQFLDLLGKGGAEEHGLAVRADVLWDHAGRGVRM